MRVLMLDDHVMFMQGLKNLLSVLASRIVIDSADTVAFALQLLSSSTYDLVLLDWHLPDCPGQVAISRLREAGCLGRIVVLSGETSASLIQQTIDFGAAGFIPKRYSSEQMISALDHVLAGQVFLPPEVLGPAARLDIGDPGSEARLVGLTARQLDVYRFAARGLPNKLIARELGIAESTVKTHLAAVYAFLGVRNRTEAAYQASRDGTRIA